ncbi:hypothetical protein CB0940_08156 [Cercospora beticola]|uniref:Nucleotide-diphospho-sugar transferase n=1 Tax=Cercospora beticola TaxID=122368 RepID=A0A2G5HR97_CERBT|nr:hypothetical protein CB0940_08156 [Cercospora beticola]PIA95050.1 hypothetical protein CB0940_08156 [Cercospora beticola]WPB04721.1 hypothetical protein RHO25_009368 [Cercospora beticola]
MRTRRPVLLLLALVLTVVLYISLRGTSQDVRHTSADISRSSKVKNNAYVIFLSSDVVDEAEDQDLEDDTYWIAARILVYQLLYAPETRTRRNYEVVVATTPTVSTAKRQRLRQDGAKVVEIEDVDAGWVQTNQTNWKSVMAKFRLWQMIQYERVMLLDADIVLQDCMDAAFDEEAVRTRRTIVPADYKPMKNEAVLPNDYAFAATARLNINGFNYPPLSKDDFMENGDALNAGFIILKPDQAMFEYYTSLTRVDRYLPNGEQLFERIWSEQALLNYTHRRDGPMPWGELDPTWMLLVPRVEHIVKGKPKALHQKWWKPMSHGIGPWLLPWKGRMDGFWEGREYAKRKG